MDKIEISTPIIKYAREKPSKTDYEDPKKFKDIIDSLLIYTEPGIEVPSALFSTLNDVIQYGSLHTSKLPKKSKEDFKKLVNLFEKNWGAGAISF